MLFFRIIICKYHKFFTRWDKSFKNDCIKVLIALAFLNLVQIIGFLMLANIVWPILNIQIPQNKLIIFFLYLLFIGLNYLIFFKNKTIDEYMMKYREEEKWWHIILSFIYFVGSFIFLFVGIAYLI